MIDKNLVEQNIVATDTASSVMASAVTLCGPLGKSKLRGAFTYLYGAMLADVVRQCQEDESLGAGVLMEDSTIKPADKFLLDYLFGTTFKPLFDRDGGKEYLDSVRFKAEAIIEARGTREKAGV